MTGSHVFMDALFGYVSRPLMQAMFEYGWQYNRHGAFVKAVLERVDKSEKRLIE